MKKRLLPLLLLVLCLSTFADERPINKNMTPFLGAQVFIEPGQTQQQIEGWFKTLKENGLTFCRIRMFESYMHVAEDKWDFTLFDHAFQAADKYGVKVYATLFPTTEKTDIGGWKFPKDEAQKASFARYIKALVTHFSKYHSLIGWVVINEPGGGYQFQSDYLVQARARWEAAHPAEDYKENGYPILMTTRDLQFCNDAITEFLRWIAAEIQKYDTAHDIHVNPYAVFFRCSEYNFPAWREFLTSLGGSAHPSGHFFYFTRQQYALAMLAQSEMLRSGAGELPWFMTEIQGGNNIYSPGATEPMCPTPEEITQWLWQVIGCESKGGIFWLLNPRSSGLEAGEWALIDFQGKPSGRLKAAKEVSEVIHKYPEIFSNLQIIPSGIDVVYFKESVWADKLMGKDHFREEGRKPDAVIKSAVACFKALTERGLNVGLKEISEYDFSKSDYSGQSIIISNQISIPDRYLKPLETFVVKGGILFVEGLSAFFDEDLHNTMNTGFTFEQLFGGNISEFILKENLFTLQVGEKALPVHLWQGMLEKTDAPVSHYNYGKGRVIWLPSNVALGAWVSDNYKPLSDYLYETLSMDEKSICYDKHYQNTSLRTLKTSKGKLLICVNKSDKQETITLNNLLPTKSIVPLFASPKSWVSGNTITIAPEGVLVLSVM